MATLTELEGIVAKIGVSMSELAEGQKKTDARLDRFVTEVSESQKETQRVMRETFDDLHRMGAETDKRIKKLTTEIGGVGRSLGTTIELVVLPGLRKKMNEFGHNFTTASPGKKFFPKYSISDDDNFAEIDLFLENGVEVMAIEVKTRVWVDDVEKFMDRLRLIRENEVDAGIVGKTIIAGIAGMVFKDDARKLAVEKGLYIIDVIEDCDNNKIDVKKPQGKMGTW